MNKEEARDLLKRYANNQCTPEEKILVERWYLKESVNPEFEEEYTDLTAERKGIWNGILVKAGLPPKQGTNKLFNRIALAAAVLVVISFGAYFYSQRENPLVLQKPTPTDPLPGGNKAVLTLSDGTRIVLDDIYNGTLATQGNLTIKKDADGRIVYDLSNAVDESNNKVGFNTISTPRGGEYQVILADGSKVWLNSASSIHFPTGFEGNSRNVKLTGEAYFEVAKDPSRPFKVETNNLSVSVLGTHFNLMAYEDEAEVKATLLEGSIKVSSKSSSALVKPGEQANFTRGTISVTQADMEQALAWKKGYFYFEKTDLKSVMRQISRWYDVDVEYKSAVPETVFSGKMYRNVRASKVLEILSYFKVNFRMEEIAGPSGRKKIIIL